MPKISVALCTHNGASFIEEQLRSILVQSVSVNEIVLSDDASTDETVELAIATVARHNSNSDQAVVELKVLRNSEALGTSANFEQALLHCTGDLLVLSDQDDRWAKSRVESAINAFANSEDILAIASDALLIDGSGGHLRGTLFETLGVSPRKVQAISGAEGFNELLRRNLVTGATMTVRPSLVAAAVPFPSSWVHDEWLAIVASLSGGLRVLRTPLVEYRQHGGNQIGASKTGWAAKVSRLLEHGSARNARLLERAGVLHHRLDSGQISATAEQVSRAANKLRHEQVRSELSQSRAKRVLAVTRECANGGYREFGHGFSDVARDLIQPLAPRS